MFRMMKKVFVSKYNVCTFYIKGRLQFIVFDLYLIKYKMCVCVCVKQVYTFVLLKYRVKWIYWNEIKLRLTGVNPVHDLHTVFFLYISIYFFVFRSRSRKMLRLFIIILKYLSAEHRCFLKRWFGTQLTAPWKFGISSK